jgi:hypothetical protein
MAATSERPALRLAALALLLVALGGCRGCTSRRPPIHLNPNMDYQAKLQPQEESTFFYDGSGMRPPVEGTVAQDEPVELTAYATGLGADGQPVAAIPAEARSRWPDLEARGAERYGIYCSPCHGDQGDGKGVMFYRGGINSADLRQARLREAPDGHFFDVITHGLGLMASYGAAVPVEDRWAIIAHVRELQAAAPPPAADEAAPDATAPGSADAAPTQTADAEPAAPTTGGAR